MATPLEAWQQRFGGGMDATAQGLPVETTVRQGLTQPGYSGISGLSQPYKVTPDVTTQRYSGAGGDFSRSGLGGSYGAWRDASGRSVSDLPGYLQMRGQQKAGSDFTGYQSRLSDLLSNPSSIENDPSYQWRKQQQEQAINRKMAAEHMGNSGNVLAELAKYSGGLASQEFGNQFNRLSDLMRGAQQFGLQSGYYSGGKESPFGINYTNSPVLW